MVVIPVMTCILLIEPIPFGHHLGGGGMCPLALSQAQNKILGIPAKGLIRSIV